MHMERTAVQIATLCATLDEFPSIRYRSSCDRNKQLATLVAQKLDAQRVDNKNMGQATRSILLIVDRGFDILTPLLHEMTLQVIFWTKFFAF